MYIKEHQFSLWVDFIERDFIATTMKELIDKGIINGATSNPAIFKEAFTTSSAYKARIQELKPTHTPKEIYEALAIEDIKSAATLLKPLYDAGDDGFVSIEVDPALANDAKATIEEGKRLFEAIGMPNVMIKIPATQAGYEAMQALASIGIPVNATLVFSLTEALSCAQAFKKASQTSTTPVKTVISVFVSRIDRAIDNKLEDAYKAKMGIINAAYIYNHIQKLHVPNCRVLFASTGVKDDSLPASYYVDNLLAPNSVNTAPLHTIEAFVANGDTTMALPLDDSIINEHFAALLDFDIALEEVLVTLKQEGLKAFEVAFSEILQSLS